MIDFTAWQKWSDIQLNEFKHMLTSFFYLLNKNSNFNVICQFVGTLVIAQKQCHNLRFLLFMLNFASFNIWAVWEGNKVNVTKKSLSLV